jgi:acylphosphatase
LTGWVRNIRDGRVEVVAEGEKGDIELLISELNEGSPMAIVEEVEVNWEEYTGEFSNFRVSFVGFF